MLTAGRGIGAKFFIYDRDARQERLPTTRRGFLSSYYKLRLNRRSYNLLLLRRRTSLRFIFSGTADDSACGRLSSSVTNLVAESPQTALLLSFFVQADLYRIGLEQEGGLIKHDPEGAIKIECKARDRSAGRSAEVASP